LHKTTVPITASRTRKKALEIYRISTGIHTATSHGQVPAMAEYLANEFRAGGFSDEDVHVLPSKSAAGEDVVSAVSKAVHARYPDIPIVPTMVPWGTDAKYARIAGIPTYGAIGLIIRDEDEFSHGLNERVPVKSFFRCIRALVCHPARAGRTIVVACG
jgi:acetylornithine deacetylase/succinyl-diaminopimelate desuccinylase-like protein